MDTYWHRAIALMQDLKQLASDIRHNVHHVKEGANDPGLLPAVDNAIVQLSAVLGSGKQERG